MSGSKNGLMSRSAVVASGTMSSRILGLVRDIMIASRFGAEATVAFWAAFQIPNFFRRLFAEGAFNQAFIPVLVEYKEKGEAKGLIQAAMAQLLVIVGVVCIIGMLATPIFVYIFAPKFAGTPKFDEMAQLLRITFPYLWFISITSLAGAVLNAHKRFFAPSVAPVLLNVCFIVATLWFTDYFELATESLAWAVFFAGLLQALFLLYAVNRISLLAMPIWQPEHPGVGKIYKLMIPAVIGSSAAQINALLDTVLATYFSVGEGQAAVSWLYFADRLVQLPLGIIAIAIATIVLPVLSEQHLGKNNAAFSKSLSWAVRVSLLIGLPAAFALGLFAEHLIAFLFYSEKFVLKDVQATAQALLAYSVALPAFMLIKVLVPGYFARKDTKGPMKISLWAIGVNMAMNFVLAFGFGMGFVGLAWATACSAWFNALLLALGLYRSGLWRPNFTDFRLMLIALFSAAIMAFATVGLFPNISEWLLMGLFVQILWVLALVAGGVLVFFIAAISLGLRPKHLKA